MKLFEGQQQYLKSLLFGLSQTWLLVLAAVALMRGETNLNITTEVIIAVTAYMVGLIVGGFLYKKPIHTKKMLVAANICNICLTSIYLFPNVPPAFDLLLVILAGLSGITTSLWGVFLYHEDNSRALLKIMTLGVYCYTLIQIVSNLRIIETYLPVAIPIGIFLYGLSIFIIFLLPVKNFSPDNQHQHPEMGTYNLQAHGKESLLAAFFFLLFSIEVGLIYSLVHPKYIHLGSWRLIYWVLLYLLIVFFVFRFKIKLKNLFIIIGGIVLTGLAGLIFVISKPTFTAFFFISTLLAIPLIINIFLFLGLFIKALKLFDNIPLYLGTCLAFHSFGVNIGLFLGYRINNSENQNFNMLILFFILILCVNVLSPIALSLPRYKKQVAETINENNLRGNRAFQKYMLWSPSDIPVEMQLTFEKLTEREEQIAELLAAGKTVREIAQELKISDNTVKYHVKNLYLKLQANNRIEFFDHYTQMKHQKS